LVNEHGDVFFYIMPSYRGHQRAASNHVHEQLVIIFLELCLYASKRTWVPLFLSMPYHRCISVVPIIGMCQAEHIPHKRIRPRYITSRLSGSSESPYIRAYVKKEVLMFLGVSWKWLSSLSL